MELRSQPSRHKGLHPPMRTAARLTHGWLSPDVELSYQVHAISPRFCFSGGIGNKDRAVELLELALKSLDGHGAKEVFQPDLLQTLANYKREEVCYGDVFVVPRTNVSSGATPKAEQENPAERGAFE